VVEWEYKPRIFVVGGAISLMSLVLVVVALVKLWQTRPTPAESS
jgi:hypothetical protein